VFSDDSTELEFPDSELRLEDAQDISKDAEVDGYVEVPIEIWTYNFGPYKLMRQVRFVDGVVDEIETLGYGYHSTPASTTDADGARRDTYK